MTTFISYSRVNSDFAVRLAQDLKSADFDVWLDQLDIPTGARWDDEIEKALEKSAAFMIILSPESIQSQNVKDEIGYAIDAGKHILPVVIENCKVPFRLRRFQYVDFTGKPYEQSLEKIRYLLANISKSAAMEKDSRELENVDNEARPTDKQVQELKRVASGGINPIGHKTNIPTTRVKRIKSALNYTIAIVVSLVFVFLVLLLPDFIRRLISSSPERTPTSQIEWIPTEPPTIPTEIDLPPQYTDEKGVEMILVPAGLFVMGTESDLALQECNKYRLDCQPIWFIDEGPPRTDHIPSFYVDKYEVGNASYRVCVDEGKCDPPKQPTSKTRTSYYDDSQFDNYPVIYVDWEMANTYCEWRGGYLPAEAQWEKAARGTDGNVYPWGNDFITGQANFCDINCDLPIANRKYDDGYKDTSSINSYSSGISTYGLYNMLGNVYEWVAGFYEPYPGGDQTGSAYYGEGYRVIRGGSWASSIDLLRTSNRDPSPSTNANWDIGFRCAKDATP
jgi:formylglycine-generating enzyme required for sulfatase activity